MSNDGAPAGAPVSSVQHAPASMPPGKRRKCVRAGYGWAKAKQ